MSLELFILVNSYENNITTKFFSLILELDWTVNSWATKLPSALSHADA